jgi:hypothetical protein
VEFAATKNLLDVARLIAGSELFIGNQSSAGAVAEGLKHRSIQEVSLAIPDCIFKRPSVQHVWDGRVDLPAIGSVPALSLTPYNLNPEMVSTGITPPGQWQYGKHIAETYPQMESILINEPEFRGKTQAEIKRAIQQATLDRLPHHYRPMHEGGRVITAMQLAGYSIQT